MGFLSDIAAFATPGLGMFNAMGGTEMLPDMLTGGAVSNAKSVSETNEKQIGLAREQMAFQERMSNTAYQRAISDMRSAGLNPALAYQNGGSSTPQGAMASLTAPRKGDIGAGLLNTAKTIATEIPQIQNTKSQTDLNRANAQVADVQAQKITANAKESEANTHYMEEITSKAAQENAIANERKKQEKMNTKIMERSQKANENVAPILPYLKPLLDSLGVGMSAYKTFRGAP